MYFSPPFIYIKTHLRLSFNGFSRQRRSNLKRMIFRSAEKTFFFSACRPEEVCIGRRNVPENDVRTSFSGLIFCYLKPFHLSKADVKMPCLSDLYYHARHSPAQNLAARPSGCCRKAPYGRQTVFPPPRENHVFPQTSARGRK